MGVLSRFQRIGWLPAAAVACALMMAACSGSPSSPPTTSPPPSVSSAPTASPAIAATPDPIASESPGSSASPAAAADDLTGTWTTGEVTCDQWNAAIAKGGLTPDQVARYDSDPNTHACPATFAVRFQAGQMVQFQDGQVEWGPGPYRIVDDHTFEAGDDCAYCFQYDYAIDGDTLRIDVVKTEDPPDPVLEQIIQTGIYESVPFTRVP